MTDRSNRNEVRNPVLSLPSVKRLAELSPATRAVIAEILGDMVADARSRAQQSWQKNKGPMAAYWKAVGAYAHHFRRVVKKPTQGKGPYVTSDYERIWLEPAPGEENPDFGQQWCRDNIWDGATEYVRADLVADKLVARDIIARISAVATAVGFQAGEPAMELAGQIVSILAANPEHIERFMAEGSGLFIDGTFNHANGSLTYRSIGGDILSPAVLRKDMGVQQ